MKDAVEAVLVAEKTADTNLRDAQEKAREIIARAKSNAEDEFNKVLKVAEKEKTSILDKAKQDALDESRFFVDEANISISKILEIPEKSIEEIADSLAGRILYGNS